MGDNCIMLDYFMVHKKRAITDEMNGAKMVENGISRSRRDAIMLDSV